MSLDGAFRVILSGLAAVGLEPEAVCSAAGVDPRTPQDATLPFGPAALARVLAEAERTTRDPLLGLHIAEHVPARGVLAYLARAQGTVGDGLRAFARFAADAWGADDVVQVAERDAHAVVELRVDPALSRHIVEFLMARTAILLRRSGASAAEVGFQHAPGAAPREYEHVLRCTVRFRQPTNRLTLHAEDLARPLRTANPEAAAALAAGMTRAPAPTTTVAARLAAVIDDALARGERPDREVLARTLGMSGRTLARRLAAESEQFSDVVDRVRRRLAERLIAETGFDVGEIADRVGFADPAAFGKAFRRWFGVSPSAFRARRSAG